MADSDPFDDSEDIFQVGNIFSNRELVRVGHVPELDRVVGRNEEVREVGAALGPAIHETWPSFPHERDVNHVFIA